MPTRWMSLAMALAFAAGGCSFSYSSKSLSDSSASGSESSASSSKSSASSSGDDAGADDRTDTAYRNDVRDQTVAFVESGESVDALQASIGDVARRYGMTDWEADPATYVGMGAGLAVARVRGERLTALTHELAGDDPAHRSALRRGYESVSR